MFYCIFVKNVVFGGENRFIFNSLDGILVRKNNFQIKFSNQLSHKNRHKFLSNTVLPIQGTDCKRRKRNASKAKCIESKMRRMHFRHFLRHIFFILSAKIFSCIEKKVFDDSDEETNVEYEKTIKLRG